MNLSVTSHLQGFASEQQKRRVVAMMKAAGFQHIRVSAMQYPIISAKNALDLHMVLDARMGLVVVVSASDGYLLLNEKQWADYCRKVVKWIPAGANAQVGNEWNSELFTGKGIQPDAKKAVTYYLIAADILLSKFPKMFLISPGVTNESKNGKGKLSARTFLSAFIDAGPSLPVSGWGLHYYHDRPDHPEDLKLLKSNIAFLQKNGRGKPIILTETGAASSGNALVWYGMLRNGALPGIEDAAYYCMDHHTGFQLVDDRLNPSSLYRKMAEDAKGVGGIC
ncbi:MAG: hypothetical protein WCP22_13170 [Chlamydiota bacterium]